MKQSNQGIEDKSTPTISVSIPNIITANRSRNKLKYFQYKLKSNKLISFKSIKLIDSRVIESI